MPEHSSVFTWLLSHIKETLSHNATVLGYTALNHDSPTWMSFEPIIVSLFVAVVLVLLSLLTRSKLANTDKALIPEERLTVRTFMEAFLGYFYDLSKSVMDPERAKKYFPIVGTSALFVFFSNVMALFPGAPVATSNLNVTLGCALVVFIVFNFYGLKVHGYAYMKHLAGPAWYLAPLVFVIEVISALRPAHHPGRSAHAEHGRGPLAPHHRPGPRSRSGACSRADSRVSDRSDSDAGFHLAHLHLHWACHRARRPLSVSSGFYDFLRSAAEKLVAAHTKKH